MQSLVFPSARFTSVRHRTRHSRLLNCLTLACKALCVVGLVQIALEPQSAAGDETKVDFEQQIRPIFKAHCYKCHGSDEQESGLRLDRRADALTGGDSGAAIVAGDSAGSLLIELVSGEDIDRVMPPEGDPLDADSIQLLKDWIDQGATWPASEDEGEDERFQHWAFQPIQRHPAPAVRSDWVKNDIDRFVFARLKQAGFAPAESAERAILIRRLSLDLLGLLPSVEEVDEFVNDSDPHAYENLVDRLLASKHFGERWGRHWLDNARYADSDGYEKDRPRPDAWRWRDWVIDAVNDDMPFDRFTVEQFAGDLLPDANADQLLATAFHRQTLTNTEGGTDQEEFRVAAVFDRVETMGTVWLGLTIGCARCHTHKYDPITQREYYQLFAFLNNGDETTHKVPRTRTAVEEYEQKLAQYQERVQHLEAQQAALLDQLGPAAEKWSTSPAAERLLEVAKLISTTVSGPDKTEFQQLEDGSVLVQGHSPDKTDTVIQLELSAGALSGLRLRLLADDRLPKKGPGRAPNGNFVLSQIQVERQVLAEGEAVMWAPVAITAAKADYAQKSFDPANALKPDSGWAVGPQMGQDHWAEFTFEKPLVNAESTRLRVTLKQQYGGTHTIGRFRLEPLDQTDTALREALATAPAERTKQQRQTILNHYAQLDPQASELINKLAKLKASAPKLAEIDVRIIRQRDRKQLRQTHMLRRGDFLQPTALVTPDTLRALPPIEPRRPDSTPDRLDLARWLVSDQNPLTPRVVVNQTWMHLFGTGLVRTVNDFGTRGERPTHPQLLDWLADEFRRLGWSRKALIKTIVMSATYRQSAQHQPEISGLDPLNSLLHRQNRFRVEAEIVRDISLQVSGLLSDKLGGPSVFPPMPPDIAALSYANNFKWNTSSGDDRYRRGMYTFFKRTAPHPNLVAFDCPDANTTCVSRNSSNTPLQALTTLNNETFVEAAQAFARRTLAARSDDRERLRFALRTCLAREATENELDILMNLLTDARKWSAEHAEQAAQLAGVKTSDAEASELAAWTATVRILLNLDEFLTRG